MRIGPVSLPRVHVDLKPLQKLGNAVDQGIHNAKDHFVDGAAQLVGYSELAGFRYSVKPYRAEVSPTLTRGSRLETAQDYEALKAQGFKAVIDLTKEGTADEKYAEAKGLKLLRVPILDNAHPTMAQMKTFLDFVSRPENQPAYVHCEAGKGRTGVAVACYRMAIQGWTLDQAMADAKKYGLSLPNQVQFLRQFDAALTAGQIPGYSR